MGIFGQSKACPPSIIRSYKNGDFTDVTITCGPLTFRVHALVIGSTCDFFKRSLRFAVGKEAEDKCIDLPEDDPEMIRRLIAYLYLGDYDPSDELEITKFNGLKQHESMTGIPPTHHSRYRKGTPGSLFSTNDKCACLAPNPTNITQPVLKASVVFLPSDYQVVEKPANALEVANPLTIHATMYALGDKYQVEGLCQLAKEKFEACLHHHVHSEDFIIATQLAYSSTPDSNRGLRDAVLGAFRTHFHVDIARMPGVEGKLESIDELSFLLIKSWPAKTGPPKPADTSPGRVTGTFGLAQPAVTSLFSAGSAQPSAASSTSLFANPRA